MILFFFPISRYPSGNNNTSVNIVMRHAPHCTVRKSSSLPNLRLKKDTSQQQLNVSQALSTSTVSFNDSLFSFNTFLTHYSSQFSRLNRVNQEIFFQCARCQFPQRQPAVLSTFHLATVIMSRPTLIRLVRILVRPRLIQITPKP